ncbi:hypothetical protein CEXT_790091 [Caerostris extrusa]|uniref:Uncharacterized protein n=1 Tax=Caerostris extrusa TaxID=172846 RepID=A0AAV4TM21_CAEEX|nr:hypothetical protein CEXT_790091 [Caerostris extrusa]
MDREESRRTDHPGAQESGGAGEGAAGPALQPSRRGRILLMPPLCPDKWKEGEEEEEEDTETDLEILSPSTTRLGKMVSFHAEARSSVDDGLSLPVLWRPAVLEGRCRNYVNVLCDVRSVVLILPDAYKSSSL